MSTTNLNFNEAVVLYKDDQPKLIQTMAEELGQLLSSELYEKEKEIAHEGEQEVQHARGVYFTEMVFYMAIFIVPIAIMFFMFSDNINTFFEENIFSQFAPDGETTPKPKASPKSDSGDGVSAWYIIMALPIVMMLFSFFQNPVKRQKQRLERIKLEYSEYNVRKEALERVTDGLVADEAQPAIRSTLRDLYAIHEHVNKHPEMLNQHLGLLTNIYGRVVLAGNMMQEIDEYADTRDEVHEIGRQRPDAEITQKQTELNITLKQSKGDLLENVQDIAQHVSVMRGEILEIESGALQNKGELMSGDVVDHMNNASELLAKQLESAESALKALPEGQ